MSTSLQVTNRPDSKSQLPRTASCDRCQSVLLTRGLIPGQRVRCSHCGHIFQFGKQDKVAADKLAWRSFWLGIASILLLFLTGIPAMYYGIRSLLRMRFVRPKASDRIAAVIGTLLGGFFGILIGAFVAIMAGVIAFTFWTVESYNEVAAVEQQLARHLVVELPEGVEGLKARIILKSQHFVDVSDSSSNKDRTFYLRLIRHDAAVAFNRGPLLGQLQGTRRPDRGKELTDEAKSLDWEIDGKPINFVRRVYRDEADNDSAGPTTFYHYHGLLSADGSFFGFALTVNLEARQMTEEDIESFFKSIKLVPKS